MNATVTPKITAARHCSRRHARNRGRVTHNKITAPKRKRHELVATGPSREKAGCTSAADHWIEDAPRMRNPAPAGETRGVDVATI